MTQTTTQPEASQTTTQSSVPPLNPLIVALIGPPGSGKTALIEATAQHLAHKLRLAVIAINPAATRDAERISHCCTQVEAIDSANPDTAAISSAFSKLHLDQIDLLLIESMGGLNGPPNLQQDHTVCVLSVSGGDDKAAEYSKLLARSSAVVLSKAELQKHVLFNGNVFRADLKSINPKAELFDISAFEHTGMDQWIKWLLARYEQKHPSLPTTEYAQPDWFLG